MAATDHNDVEFGGVLHRVANFTRSFHVELRLEESSTWNNVYAAAQQSIISLQRYAALFSHRGRLGPPWQALRWRPR
jgi:hypothetical protein